MQQIFKKITAASLAFLPLSVMAHPGHGHEHERGQNALISGFVHPFTGLDHLMMALAFGVLIWTAHRRWKALGIAGLSIALVVGFLVGAQINLPTSLAENGIIFSLILLAIALWSKAHKVIPILVAALAGFHGIAHGAELGQSGHAALLILGMVTAMASIYGLGLALGSFIEKYVPYGKQVVGVLAVIVAVIGLA